MYKAGQLVTFAGKSLCRIEGTPPTGPCPNCDFEDNYANCPECQFCYHSLPVNLHLKLVTRLDKK